MPCYWCCVLTVIAVAAAMLVGQHWRRQLLHAKREHRAQGDLTARLEETIIKLTREAEERDALLQSEKAKCKSHEDALQLADRIFQATAEAIIVTDTDNKIVRVNPAFTAITGYTPAEVLGCNPRLLKSDRHDSEFYCKLWDDLDSRGQWEGEIWNRCRSGEICVSWLSITRVCNGMGGVQYLGVFHDITRHNQAEALLHFRAHHDALTELPNRDLFEDRLRCAINQARRDHQNFTLLLIDLDHFKEINDSLGHAAGDQLLVEAAQRLAGCARETDTAARLGGDEFAIILSAMTDGAAAEQVARRAVSLLAQPYYLDAGTVRISICVGISLYPLHGRASDTLLRSARGALRAAKESGGNTYCIAAALDHNTHAQADLI